MPGRRLGHPAHPLNPATRPAAPEAAGRVLRFTATERLVHWSFAACFTVLAGTGLGLWAPALSEAIGHRELLRRIHILTGLALVIAPVAMALAGNRRAATTTVAELGALDREDRAFLLRRPSAPGRFNGGQKLNSIWSATVAMLFLLTGIVQWRWSSFPPEWRSGASQLHDLLTVLSLLVVAGHVHLSVVHRSTRPAMRGMVTGHVERAWAEEHHPRWLDGATAASGARFGRRTVLAGLGAGAVAVVTGGRLLPTIELPSSDGGWRIYNVAGSTPSPAGFRLVVDGLVQRPRTFDLKALTDLTGVERIRDFECVTGWKVDDVAWRGILVRDLVAGARPLSSASHLTFHSRDGVYTDSLTMAQAAADDTMIALEMNGRPLPLRHGGPARLVVPTMYGYKSVKWVGRIELTDHEHVGYWEQRGYARDARIDTSGRETVFDGTRTELAGLGLSILVPPGWRADALPGGGTVFHAPTPGGERIEASVIETVTTVDADRALTQSMLSGMERAGLTDVRRGVIPSDGLTADTVQADDGSGQRFLFAFYPDGRRVIQLHGQAPATAWSAWAPVFEQMAASLQRQTRG